MLKAIAGLFKHTTAQRVQILEDFEGLIRPGEMLLVLGRPGSGYSTFLKALSGHSRGVHLDDEAEIEYQDQVQLGIPYDEMHRDFKGDCVYISEFDVHFPRVTLGQTLDFTASTRDEHPDATTGIRAASMFGLDKAFDTKIGNAIIRGISGGKKRRTSIAEHGSNVGTTIFDKITLLYEGRQIYFGPVDSASDYSTALGFVRPNRATTSDFLTSMTNPEERVVADGYENRVPRSPGEFARVWKQSSKAIALRAEVEVLRLAQHSNDTGNTDLLRLQTSTYHPLQMYQQLGICIHRAFLRLRSNPSATISAVIANSILGLVVGSAFYNTGETTDDLLN
ncbi:Multidrug resistance protein CDR2 [Cytospora mali]|uniref:Multidrug resistance protein CDR2 n=1 Tax=Cytospora mali TaxID=578113 RepID=A0A194VU35_CYTMA|nr:Multidrug resistance protein CDR2 [Valsa mali]